MDEGAKNKLIVILLLSAVIFFIISVSSCNNSRRQSLARNKEMAIRFQLEEKINEERVAHEATKKILLEEESMNQSLRDELQKITKLKEALEEDLKKVLLTANSKKKIMDTR